MRATRLPPMRNPTGPHRARHSVFRHPATMPDKAGVEVYRYARRPVDSLVCISPIRGTGNASVRSCCALYGYVSGSHAVHPHRRKSGPSCAWRSTRRHRSTPRARCAATGRRTRPCRLGTSRASHDSASRKTPAARVTQRSRQCETHDDGPAQVSRRAAPPSMTSVPVHDSLRPHRSRGVRGCRKVRSMAGSMSSATCSGRFAAHLARPAVDIPLACEKNRLYETEQIHGSPTRYSARRHHA